MIPRAGLLGSLTAIALVLISFLPLFDIVSTPVAGMTALAVILVTLTARWTLPRKIPGALAAVVVGCLVYYGMHLVGLGPGLGGGEGGRPEVAFRASLPVPIVDWYAWFQATWRLSVVYLPVAIPLALGTIIGGIDCTESAASVGDEYPTGQIIAAEGFATIVGGIFGGVIQSTPYIGHPAYKAMGAGAAYTLATALFIGGAGVFGYFDWIFYLLPKAVVFPILIFVGLEITAQSFHATPIKHYPAVALACVPALAYLAALVVSRLAGSGDLKPFGELSGGSQHYIQTITVLSGGFIVTSLLWSSILTHLIDGRIRPSMVLLFLAGVCALFGVIHSPLATGPIIPPQQAIAELKTQGSFDGFDLRLLSPLKEVGELPTEGRKSVIIAKVEETLHFRVFDRDEKIFLDTDAKSLSARATDLAKLEERLASLWPPHRLTVDEKPEILLEVCSILGRTRYEATKLQTPYHWAAAYWISAALLLALGKWGKPPADLSSGSESVG
jgi:AGZA family xanthine/uracil permease-like MFS transporter